jgi:hypothetical protein
VHERAPASEPTLDEVKELLRPRLARERREKAYEAFVATLEQQARIQVDEQALTSVSVASASPTETSAESHR